MKLRATYSMLMAPLERHGTTIRSCRGGGVTAAEERRRVDDARTWPTRVARWPGAVTAFAHVRSGINRVCLQHRSCLGPGLQRVHSSSKCWGAGTICGQSRVGPIATGSNRRPVWEGVKTQSRRGCTTRGPQMGDSMQRRRSLGAPRIPRPLRLL